MMELTELERGVLEKLLQGDHPSLDQLRAQLATCRVSQRELTGAGFYAYLDVRNAPPANDLNVRFGDVIAEIEGMAHGAGFLLYIEQGRLSMLEGYAYEDQWPSTITAFRLRYAAGEKRDWTALVKVLA